MSEKHKIGNWKPFARFYNDALASLLDAMNICDNQEVREEIDNIYTIVADLGETLNQAN